MVFLATSSTSVAANGVFKMKFALFVVLSCLSVYLVSSESVATWGNINGGILGVQECISDTLHVLCNMLYVI